jgi:hypothetical protein
MLSPDGKQLLYVTRYETETGLRLRNLETGEDRWVRYPITRDDQEAIFSRDLFPGYAFFPDGKEILYNQDGKIRCLNPASGAESVVPFTANVKLDLGPKLYFPQRVEEGPVKVRLIQDPVESPDGKRMAFSAMTHLYVIDLPNGKPRQLLSDETHQFQPAWSPDGKWLTYVTWSNAGGQLWKVSSEGGTPVQLTRTPALYSNPVWSPEGTRIVLLRGNAYDREHSEFDGGQTSNADLIWLPSEGGDGKLILPARGAGSPHFTHDKERIYVNTPQGVVSLGYDGTDRITHLQVKGTGDYSEEEPIAADDLRVSPDGQWVLAQAMNQLFLVAMPVVGGEAPTIVVTSGVVPVKRISDIGADYVHWSDDGKTISWAVGACLFRQPLSSISFEKPKDEKDKEEKQPAASGDADKKDGNQAAAKSDEKEAREKRGEKAQRALQGCSGNPRCAGSASRHSQGHHRSARRHRHHHEGHGSGPRRRRGD